MAERSPEPSHPVAEPSSVPEANMSPSPAPHINVGAAEAALVTLGPTTTTTAVTTSLSPTNANSSITGGKHQGSPTQAGSGPQSPPPIHIKRLTPIESLIMHKDLRRKSVNDDDVLIRELEYILTKSVSRGPSLSRIDLYGPDTLNVSRNPAAMEYLKNLGFVQVAEEKGRRDSNTAPAIPAAPGHVHTPPAAHGPIRHYLQLANVPAENSSDWQIFRSDVGKALEELRRARETDAGLLTVMLHRFIFFQPMKTDYRVELVAKEGGNGAGSGDAEIGEGGEVDKDIAAALAAARIAAGVAASAGGPGKSAQAADTFGKERVKGEEHNLVEETHSTDFFGLDDAVALTNPASIASQHPASSTSATSHDPSSSPTAPPHTLTLYQNMMATFPLAHIAGPCTLDVLIYRRRTIRGDKPKAIGTLFFDNSACVRKEIDLKDPRAPGGLPIGRITVEVQSLRLRHAALEEASGVSKSTTGASGLGTSTSTDDKAAQKDHNSQTKEDHSAPHAVWIDQQAIITAAATARAGGGDYAHTTYDADDYF